LMKLSSCASVTPMKIRKVLLEAMDQSPLTYEQLGKLLGISESAVHKKLHHEGKMWVVEAEAMAKIFGITFSCEWAR